MTQIIKFIDKDIQCIIITAFHTFKKLEVLNTVSIDIKYILKIKVLEVKMIISEIINILIRINGRLDITEENICKDVKIYTSENIAVEIIQDPEIKVTKEKKKREKENPHNISELWDNVKWPNIYAIGDPKEEETENILKEIRASNFPSMMKTLLF